MSRRAEAISLRASGMKITEIAQRMKISPYTVKRHLYCHCREYSARELQIMEMRSHGSSKAEIAAALGITRKTVDAHITNFNGKSRGKGHWVTTRIWIPAVEANG